MTYDTYYKYGLGLTGLLRESAVSCLDAKILFQSGPDILNATLPVAVLADADKVLTIDDTLDLIIFGGKMPYSTAITRSLGSTPFSITPDETDDAKFSLKALAFGCAQISAIDTINRKKAITFLVDPRVRNSASEEITELTLAVGETAQLNYWAGFDDDIFWQDLGSPDIVGFSPNNGYGYGNSHAITLTGLTPGITTCRATGLYGQYKNFSVTIAAEE